MNNNNFFQEQTLSSRIKASIVSEYFPSYCKIITNRYKPKLIRYIDLFAGPGVYDDGNVSTPILIGRQCYSDDFLKNNVRFIFNDNCYSQKLKQNFKKEFPDGTFKHKPHFGQSTVGENEEIKKFLIEDTHVNNKNEQPSLLFIDPFGYKGVETTVLANFLKNWGNEIFLFLNTKRINAAIENNKFEDLMLDLFPTTLTKIQQDKRFTSSVSERLNLIINNLGDEYKSYFKSKVYYTAFKFQEEDINATSHYIVHLTKGARGFDLIKSIYNDFANVGTIFDGINTYTFDAKKFGCSDTELFDMGSINIDCLKDELYEAYKNMELTASALFDEHQISNLYSRSHYAEALRRLEKENKLETRFVDNKKHRVSVLISNDCILKFK